MTSFLRSLAIGTLIIPALLAECYGVFTYENAGNAGKSGNFSFFDENEKLVFQAEASAGYMKHANDPFSQGLKNKGPIPQGTWYVTGIKNDSKSILILTPSKKLKTHGRDGFLIHGFPKSSSPELASRGCIILGPKERKILKKYFVDGENKPLKIQVNARVSGNGV